MPTALTKPITRQLGRLVVTIDSEGVMIRGVRKRRTGPNCRRLTCCQLAAFADDPRDVMLPLEEKAGREILTRIGALPREA